MGILDFMFNKNNAALKTPQEALEDDFRQATSDLSHLIQQQENVSFFRRQFVIPLRHFFHSMFPTVALFKSSLVLAFEKFATLRESMRAQPEKVKQADIDIGNSLKNLAYRIMGNSLLYNALYMYIDHQTNPIRARRDDVANYKQEKQSLWECVRIWIKDYEGSSDLLNDVLDKLRMLYPDVIDDDFQYVKAQKLVVGSTMTMHQLGLASSHANLPSTTSDAHNPMHCKPLFSGASTLLQKRIDVLGRNGQKNSCWYIQDITALQQTLKQFLDCKQKNNCQEQAEQLSKEILECINKATIYQSVDTTALWTTGEQTTFLKAAKETLTQLHDDINVIGCSNTYAMR